MQPARLLQRKAIWKVISVQQDRGMNSLSLSASMDAQCTERSVAASRPLSASCAASSAVGQKQQMMASPAKRMTSPR